MMIFHFDNFQAITRVADLFDIWSRPENSGNLANCQGTVLPEQDLNHSYEFSGLRKDASIFCTISFHYQLLSQCTIGI